MKRVAELAILNYCHHHFIVQDVSLIGPRPPRPTQKRAWIYSYAHGWQAGVFRYIAYPWPKTHLGQKWRDNEVRLYHYPSLRSAGIGPDPLFSSFLLIKLRKRIGFGYNSIVFAFSYHRYFRNCVALTSIQVTINPVILTRLTIVSYTSCAVVQFEVCCVALHIEILIK